MPNRRNFFVQLSAMGIALGAAHVSAQVAMVSESDAQAAALGYKADDRKVDKVKFPKS